MRKPKISRLGKTKSAGADGESRPNLPRGSRPQAFGRGAAKLIPNRIEFFFDRNRDREEKKKGMHRRNTEGKQSTHRAPCRGQSGGSATCERSHRRDHGDTVKLKAARLSHSLTLQQILPKRPCALQKKMEFSFSPFFFKWFEIDLWQKLTSYINFF